MLQNFRIPISPLPPKMKVENDSLSISFYRFTTVLKSKFSYMSIAISHFLSLSQLATEAERQSRLPQYEPLLASFQQVYSPWQLNHAPPQGFCSRRVLRYTFAILMAGTLLMIFLFFYSSIFVKGTITILISIDGFRAEYLQRNLTPNLMRLAQRGFVAKHLIPSYPTLTFPNHYSIATGLYPSQHGIIANAFYDPILNRTFNYLDPNSYHHPIWWGGEPIWVTAEQQGKIAGMLHWVGSDVPIKGVLPTHYASYAPTPLAQRFAQVQTWLRLPLHARRRTRRRPHLIGMYVPDIDSVGHAYGPESAQLNETLKALDHHLGAFLDFLAPYTPNVLVVSDHGMTATAQRIALDTLLCQFAPRVTVRFRGSLLLLDPHRDADRMPLVHHLQAQARHFSVYLKENVPPHLHYSDNPRITSVVVIPENGHVFVSGNDSWNIGMHGFRTDSTHDMDAIFIAHTPGLFQPHKVVPAFKNIEIYNLLCKLLHIKPAKNSGRGLPWLV